MAASRPRIPMMVFTPNAAIRSQLSVVWGIETFLVPPASHTDQMVEQIDAELLAERPRPRRASCCVLIAGVPPGIAGTTNSMRVHIIGAGSVERRL